MKNKPITWVLIVAVIGLWGIILRRLLAGNDQAISVMPTVIAESEQPKLSTGRLTDTFTLVLNYRDPFSGREGKEAVSVVASVPERRVKSPVSKPAKPEHVKYAGFIRNSTGKAIVSLITISGQERMMQDGESASGVDLLKNSRDSIQIRYQGNVFFIKKD